MLEQLLRVPQMYSLAMAVVGARKSRQRHVSWNIRPYSGCSILDLGCGPGDILNFLPPEIYYVGIDAEQSYINFARGKHGHNATFVCQDVSGIEPGCYKNFDVVCATGFLHHLDDEACSHVFKVAKEALRNGGRFVSYDGCYRKGQHWLDKWMLDHDRGRFVRTADEYVALARQVFPNVEYQIRHDYLSIPYTIIVLNCVNKVRNGVHELTEDFCSMVRGSTRSVSK